MIGRPHFPPCGGSPRPEEIRACPRVRAFDVGILGKSIAFGVTKNVRNKALRASAGPATAVPVSSEAGF